MFEWEYRLVKSIPIVVVVLLFLNIFIVPHFEHYDDWNVGLPESDAFWNLYAGAYCVAGLSLFIILYLYVTHNKKTAGADSERHRIG